MSIARSLILTVLFIAFLPSAGTIVRGHPEGQSKAIPLKIISTRPVEVPDEARGVRGRVRLLVEYRSDNTIGTVRCLNRDDREREKMERVGLIDAAIAAARKTVFRPRMVDGQPVTVFATRDYVFH